MENYNLKVLSNGLRVASAQMPGVKSTTVIVGVGAGSRYETRRISGLSHFLEHMAFKGTRRRPSSLILSSEVLGLGGKFNAFTDKEFTGYWIKIATNHLEKAFDILSDILSESLFDPKEIEKEKGVIIEEINMRQDTPMVDVAEAFSELIYGDNPMGRDIAGKKETVMAIKRGDFTDYLSRLYFPKNMVVAVAGGVGTAAVGNLAEIYFGGSKDIGNTNKKTIKIEQNRAKLRVIKKKTEQAHFCLGVPAYDLFHPDRYVLAVLAAVLGGGMSSRLFTQIREKRGLAYYVGTGTELRTDSGYLVSRAGVKLEKTGEAIKVIKEEMEKLAKKEVGEKELSRTKEMLKGHFILALEDSAAIAEEMAADLVLENRLYPPEEIIKGLEKVTSQDVLRVSRDIFVSNKLNLTVIGPYKQEDFLSLLGA